MSAMSLPSPLLPAWAQADDELKFETVADKILIMQGTRSRPNPQYPGYHEYPALICGNSAPILAGWEQSASLLESNVNKMFLVIEAFCKQLMKQAT